jgi:phosphatidylinositol alpha-mannosyltransferase
MVSPYDHERPGGVQVQVAGMSSALRARGHDVEIIHPGSPGPDLISYAGSCWSIPYNGSRSPISLSVRAARNLVALLRTGAYDVVHHHEPLAPAATFGINCSPICSPRVASFYAYPRGAGLLFQRVTGRLFESGWAEITAVSELVRSRITRIAERSVRLVRAGTPLASLGTEVAPPDARGNRILFVGRDERRKGLRVLLDAYRRINHLPVELHIVGPIGTQNRRAAMAVGAVVHGEVSESEVVNHLCAARVLCAPSLFGESAGVVLIEALCAGAHLVASDIPGYRETIQAYEQGHLVPPGSSAALAAALTEIITGGDASGPEVAKARSLASFEHVATALEETYASVLKR